MSIQTDPAGYPRLEGQQSEIAVGSPTAVIALFTEIVRERFRAEHALPWIYEDNYTPKTTEANDPDAPRRILVEPAFNENVEVRNYRPAVFVDKGDTVLNKVVLNNMAGQRLQSGFKGFYIPGTMPIEIEAVSDQKGESALLADLIWFYIVSGREAIRASFGFRELTEPVLGRTVPFEQDKMAWSTKVSFAAEVSFRWTTVPISPLLRQIVLRFQASGESNPDAFLLKRYIR